MAENSVKQAQDSAKEIELLAEVSQLFTQFDMQRGLGKIIRLVANAVGATRAHLALHSDYDLDWRQIFQTDKLHPDTTYSVSVGQLETGLAGWVARERKGTLVEDIQTDERRALFESDLGSAKSALAVPFISSGELMAVLTLSHPEAKHFTADHLRLTQIAGNQAGVAVRNARLENHVLARQRQLEAVLHAIDDMVLVVDKSGKVLIMNMAVIRYLDIRHNRKKDWFLPQLAEMDRVFDRVQDIVHTISSDTSNWRFKARSDQRKRDFEVLMSIWENPLQGISGYVIVLHDVTTLTDLDRFKNDMLKMASHDLRSPLSLISGYCDMVELDLGDALPESNLRKYLDVIRRTTHRMDDILTDLLRVEQVQSSPLELHQKVELLPMLRMVVEHEQTAAEQKKQELKTEFADLPEGIMADPAMLREAMENLVSNAIKYTPDGGKVTVRAYSKEKRFYFVVEDTGYGIGPEHMSKLFKSFYRAKQAGTEHITGTGLGLSLVKAVIERHHGEVTVESVVSKGSTFTFWLPLEDKDAAK